MEAWGEIAARYHKRWASRMQGPLQSTKKLIEGVGAGTGDRVLDVACGTGLVTNTIAKVVGESGHVVGADTSVQAIRIAQRAGAPNVSFVNMDGENMAFAKKFDIVTCQFALFFFPDAGRALKCMRDSLADAGRVGIVVHGSADKAPFYGAILDAAARFIPDYIPEGTPQLDRFSTSGELVGAVADAGFSDATVREYVFEYSPGTFEEYWGDYLRYVAGPVRAKIDALGKEKRAEFREEVRRNTEPYADGEGGVITFPWQVLVLTAMR